MWIKLLLLVIGVVAAEKVRYDNYALYKVHPASDDEVKFLKKLQETDEDLHFWKPASHVGEFVSIVSPPEKRDAFEQSLKNKTIFSELMQENIQEALDAQLHSRAKRDTSNLIYWTNYQTYDDIIRWFVHLTVTYSGIVSMVYSGRSPEGREILGIKIARGNPKRAFFLVGGEVGADWLSPSVLTYIVDQLVRGEDPEAKLATEQFEWYIFPVVNPDGFHYSQNSERLWIKNRRPVRRGSSSGIGVDLSKNWNSQWGVSGGSFTLTANNFVGIGPFTEVETRQLSQYIESIGPKLTGFFAFRSFGQRLAIPFAHHNSNYPLYNYNEMITIGRRAMGSLAVKYNTQYLVGTSKEVHDGATGSIVDWTKHRFNPPLAATYFLRDEGTWGYTLPVNQIEPTCEETYDSLMAILREARFINVI